MESSNPNYELTVQSDLPVRVWMIAFGIDMVG
jgi:hypothetical protein